METIYIGHGISVKPCDWYDDAWVVVERGQVLDRFATKEDAVEYAVDRFDERADAIANGNY